jgi:hypothetical protein
MKWPTYSELNAFYGDPDTNDDGRPDAAWEAANIVQITPPYPMTWSWSGKPAKAISLHKKCAPDFLAALQEVGRTFDPVMRAKFQLDRCGGGYNFRTMRGSDKLSVHSWGAAIDLAPEINWLGRRWGANLGMMPMAAVQIFEKRGFVWGGRFKTRPDCMHIEATRR